MDPRATQLAEVMVGRSLNIQKGDKLVIAVSDLTPMDLIHEAYRLAVERGAFVELDVMGLQLHRGRSDLGGLLRTFLKCACEEQLTHVSDLTKAKLAWGDKFLFIIVVHDPLFLSTVDCAKLALWRSAHCILLDAIINKTWVLTQWPTEALAVNADMDLPSFTDFFFASCLIDYDEEAKRLQLLQDVLDAGRRVRIRAPGTDLTLGIESRLAAGTNLGRRNIPDGECFVGPEEHVTEGEVTFELPQIYDGNEIHDIHLIFREGRVASADASRGQDYLQALLDAHPGNRRFGELGIGMNRAITRYMKCILFDEKIAGTVHMALGRSYEEERGGGKNRGSIHWDLIKDLRSPGTLVTVDERVIIRDGEVLV